MKFVCELNSCHVNVLIDICNIVEMNNVGGLTRWVQRNLSNADNIIIFVTSSYVTELEMISNEDDVQKRTTDCPRKTQLEINLIEKMTKEGLNDKILVVCLGVEQIPAMLKQFKTVQFPDTQNLVQNPDFQYIL